MRSSATISTRREEGARSDSPRAIRGPPAGTRVGLAPGRGASGPGTSGITGSPAAVATPRDGSAPAAGGAGSPRARRGGPRPSPPPPACGPTGRATRRAGALSRRRSSRAIVVSAVRTLRVRLSITAVSGAPPGTAVRTTCALKSATSARIPSRSWCWYSALSSTIQSWRIRACSSSGAWSGCMSRAARRTPTSTSPGSNFRGSGLLACSAAAVWDASAFAVASFARWISTSSSGRSSTSRVLGVHLVDLGVQPPAPLEVDRLERGQASLKRRHLEARARRSPPRATAAGHGGPSPPCLPEGFARPGSLPVVTAVAAADPVLPTYAVHRPLLSRGGDGDCSRDRGAPECTEPAAGPPSRENAPTPGPHHIQSFQP